MKCQELLEIFIKRIESGLTRRQKKLIRLRARIIIAVEIPVGRIATVRIPSKNLRCYRASGIKSSTMEFIQHRPFLIVLTTLLFFNCQHKPNMMTMNPYYSRIDTAALHLPDSVWKQVLPDSVYVVARGKETEEAFTGKFWNYDGIGTYYCAACGNALFRSDAKFASTC